MTVPVHGLPPLLQVGLRVAVVPPPLKEERWRTVLAVLSEDERGSLVRLSGCDDIASAESLVGTVLLADRADLPADIVRYDVDALLERAVVDEATGRVGRLTEVLRGPANDVWEIRFEGEATASTYLVPVVDEFIEDVPWEGLIRVRIPEGLEPTAVESDAPTDRGES